MLLLLCCCCYCCCCCIFVSHSNAYHDKIKIISQEEKEVKQRGGEEKVEGREVDETRGKNKQKKKKNQLFVFVFVFMGLLPKREVVHLKNSN